MLTQGLRAVLIRDNNYRENILTNPDFETSHMALLSKRKQPKSIRLGNKKNKTEALPYDDENQMWESGSLGTKDPDVLHHTTWYMLSKLL